VITLPLFTAQLVLFSADTYNAALRTTSALERLPDAAGMQLYLSLHYVGSEGGAAEPGDAGPGGPPPALRSLSEEQFRALFRRLLPPETLRPIAEGFFGSLFAAAGGSRDPVTVSFGALKERFGSGAAVDAYIELMRAQPPCTDAQLQALLAKGVTELPTCRPPDAVVDQLRPALQVTLAGVVEGIPDQQNMTDTLSPQVVSTLQTTRTVLLLSPLVPIFFLLLTIAFGSRTRRGMLRWWGVVLALGGGAVGAFALALPSFFDQRWDGSLAPSVPPYWSPTLVGIGHDVAIAIVAAFATALAIVSGVVALVGIVSLVVAARLGRQAAVPEPAPSAGGVEPNS